MDRVVLELLKRFRHFKQRTKRKPGFTIDSPFPASLALVLLSFSSLFSTLPAHALTLSNEIQYYGENFYADVRAGDRDTDLINTLRTILVSQHQRHPGQPDTIGGCDITARDCYRHTPIGYSAARKEIMGDLYLGQNASGYFVKDVYCQKEFTDADFKHSKLGPGVTPEETVLNVEHTWPQSRFSSRFDTNTQKSDLHHLFPADTKMNSIRGNMTFGEVDHDISDVPCPQSRMGTVNGQGGTHRFEPPAVHKGNVARALFYFSVRYSIHIDPREEAFLRKWHREDPVDDADRARNEKIMKIQGNRNPFIDYPELVDSISDF
jgi:hypothetical protein